MIPTKDRIRSLRVATLQSRLGRSQDDIRRAVIDNNARLVSTPTDTIRCRSRKTFEGDNISLIVEKADVLSIVYPPMKDVPIRKIRRDKDAIGHWQLSSLVSLMEDGDQKKYYTCNCLNYQDLDVGDLLFRIMMDDFVDFPTVVILEVVELVADIGEHKPISFKFNAAIPTDDIPQDIVDTVCQMVERRKKVGF